jgi:NAD-dependent deacetylase
MLVIGTSATVQPAAYIPVISKQSGAKVIEINAESTPLSESVSDYLITGQAGAVTSRIVAELERLLPPSGG